MAPPNETAAPDWVLLGALGLAAGATLPLAPLPASLAIVALCALEASRAPRPKGVGPPARARDPRRAVRLGMVVLLVAAGAQRAGAALEAADLAYRRAAAELSPPAACQGRGIVVRSPVVERAQGGPGDSATGQGARVVVALARARCGGHELDRPLRVRLVGAPEDLARGDEVLVVARLAPPTLLWNPGLRDPRIRIALGGVAASGPVDRLERLAPGAGLLWWIDRTRARVRQRIEATFPPDSAPLARALVLGETDLDDTEMRAFRRSGLAHLLAVSGTHLVLVVLAAVRALRSLLVRIERVAARGDAGALAAGLGAGLCFIYADFAGGGGSAYRAAAMLGVALLCRAAGRRASRLRCFAAALGAGLLVEPLAIGDLSFLLSLGATGGLFASRDLLARATAGRTLVGRAIVSSVGVTAAAMAGCAPFLLLLGPELPLLAVLANVLAAPACELCALPLCLVHALLWWLPVAEQGAALVAAGALGVVRAVAHAASASAAAVVCLREPTCEQLGALAVGVGVVLLGRSARRRAVAAAITVGCLLLLELEAVRAGSPKGILRVSVLDVGQGDSTLVDLPDGTLMVVDGGDAGLRRIDAGARALGPVLRTRRRGRVDVLVVTHPHPDHYQGLESALRGVEVGEVWDTGEARARRPVPQLVGLLDRLQAQGARLRGQAELCAGPRQVGGAEVRVLAPCPAYEPAAPPNHNSMVLRIAFGERVALLMGDADAAQERQLLARAPAALGADVLKVGHHGSRLSTTAPFLAAVSPAVAVVSCGVRNRFGHPDTRVWSSLASSGALGLRTDRGGAVLWETDGRRVIVSRPAGELARFDPLPAW